MCALSTPRDSRDHEKSASASFVEFIGKKSQKLARGALILPFSSFLLFFLFLHLTEDHFHQIQSYCPQYSCCLLLESRVKVKQTDCTLELTVLVDDGTHLNKATTCTGVIQTVSDGSETRFSS